MNNKLTSDMGAMYKLSFTMLLMAPVIWGVNQAITVLVIELLSLVLIWMAFMRREILMRDYKLPVYLLLALIAFILVQLLPVPFSFWLEIPGRSGFSEIYSYMPESYSSGWRPISVVPASTEMALLYLLPPISVFLCVLLLDKSLLIKLMWLVFAIATIQSFIGLLQYGGGLRQIWGASLAGNARGTYLNSDHLAAYLAMIFPLVLAMLASTFGHSYRSRRRSGSRRAWHFLRTLKGNQSLVFMAVAALIMLCLIFTRSRSGIALLMIGMLLSLFAFSRRLGGSNIYGVYGTTAVVILVLAFEIGLAPIVERFSIDQIQDSRWEIYAITMRAIGDYFPFGSGMGTFSSIYTAYQSPDMDYFINHAHNDYLQWILEGGLPILLLLLAGLYLYVMNWRYVWTSDRWDDFRFIQVGAGIGIFLVLLHSFFDFSLHKPANNLLLAYLLALFFKKNSYAIPQG